MTRPAYRIHTPLLIGALALASSALAGAPESKIEGTEEAAPPPINMNVDWPCVQRKVESLTASQMWDGPSIEGVKGWFKDKAISDLIELLSSRRVPIEEGEAAIQKFAEAQPEDKRDAQLTLLFAGLFDKINSQRRSVLSGIEKYQKSQKERAKELERQSTEIAHLESESASNESIANKLDQANEHYNWAQRIFQERQSSIPLACELPVLMEERLYAFTRSIRGLMKT